MMKTSITTPVATSGHAPNTGIVNMCALVERVEDRRADRDDRDDPRPAPFRDPEDGERGRKQHAERPRAEDQEDQDERGLRTEPPRQRRQAVDPVDGGNGRDTEAERLVDEEEQRSEHELEHDQRAGPLHRGQPVPALAQAALEVDRSGGVLQVSHLPASSLRGAPRGGRRGSGSGSRTRSTASSRSRACATGGLRSTTGSGRS